MLSQIFKAPARVRVIRSSPAGSLLEEFAAFLFESGYAEKADTQRSQSVDTSDQRNTSLIGRADAACPLVS